MTEREQAELVAAVNAEENRFPVLKVNELHKALFFDECGEERCSRCVCRDISWHDHA